MNRRNFIKAASCGALLTGALPSVSHAAAENRPPIPGSLGMLYDSTLCVGCQACVTKCQDINFPERNPQGEQTWSNNDKLSPYTNNIIQVWTSGTGVNKDQEENGYAYIKKQCMHCVDPNCVSVCPVSALKKDPKTGIVHYDKDVCTGCRYCMVACPYNVPKYDLLRRNIIAPHLYGEKEGGGTQVLVLTGVPYENLDLPKLDDLSTGARSTGARSEHVQHTLYKGMMLPLAVLAGLTVLVRRNTKNDHHDGGDDHES